jgi:Rhs element Vgr protein
MAKIIKNFCQVLIGGKNVAATPGIVSVMIKHALNRIPLAEVVLYDGPSVKKNFPLSQDTNYIPGKSTVTIKMGKTEDKLVTVFSGIIIGQTLKAPLNEPGTIKLELRDPMIASTVIRRNRYFKDMDDSNIAFKIVGDYPDVMFGEFDGGATHKEMVQYNCTDWDFLLSRAEANGFFAVFKQPKEGPCEFSISPPSFSPGSKTIKYGKDIVEFEANLSARDQYESVKSEYWKYADQKAKSENSTGTTGDVQGNVTSSKLADILGGKPYHQQTFGNLEDKEVKDWSQAKAMRSRLSKVQGRVRIYGDTEISPGDVIVLEGVGETYGPNAFVCEVMHSLSASSTWYTDIKFGYDDEWFYERHNNIMDKSAAGLLPGIQGLCCGTVKKIVDPDGQYRVMVNIPFVNVDPDSGAPTSDGVWARMVSADAGGGKRGILIRPEVDDEVIVGFLNNDPRDPVILGTVFSSTKNKVPTDLEIKEDNINKGWITLGETKFLIDDTKDKQKITVETKKKNTIIISDADKSITIMDQNKNKIVMDDKGILIQTDKDLTMKAKGKILMEGTKDVTAESKSGKLIAKGSTGAEVTTSGKAVLKGSVVNIN